MNDNMTNDNISITQVKYDDEGATHPPKMTYGLNLNLPSPNFYKFFKVVL